METTTNFEDAVQKLYATKFIAPQYFIVAGAGPYQGAVLTIDRLGFHLPATPLIQRMSMGVSGAWHLVQTNDDAMYPPLDDRRGLAELSLKSAKQSDVNEEFVMNFMRKDGILFNNMAEVPTAFTTVMVPATGYYKTIVQDTATFPQLSIRRHSGSLGA